MYIYMFYSKPFIMGFWTTVLEIENMKSPGLFVLILLLWLLYIDLGALHGRPLRQLPLRCPIYRIVLMVTGILEEDFPSFLVAPTSCTWSFSPLNDLINLSWVDGVIALPIGVITPFKNWWGPTLCWRITRDHSSGEHQLAVLVFWISPSQVVQDLGDKNSTVHVTQSFF